MIHLRKAGLSTGGRILNGRTAATSALPRIASPSLWASIIPKFMRPGSWRDPHHSLATRNKAWNPATYFIVMSLLIGSNAIQLVSLKTAQLNYQRNTEVKLELLREVVRRVQNGEEVDVKAMLGTGDPIAEKEWEEVMKDLNEDQDFIGEKERKRAQKLEKEAASSANHNPMDDISQKTIRTQNSEIKGTNSGFY